MMKRNNPEKMTQEQIDAEARELTNMRDDINARLAQLEKQKKQLKQDNKAALSAACFRGDVETVKVLLDKGVSINHGQIVYPIVLNFSKPEEKAKAEQKQANEKYQYLDPIQAAIKGDHPDVLRLLIEKAGTVLEKFLGYYAEWTANYNAQHTEYNDTPYDSLSTDDNIKVKNIVHINDENACDSDCYYSHLQRLVGEKEAYSDADYMSDDEENNGHAKLPHFYGQRQFSLLTEAILFNSEKCAEVLITEFNASPKSQYVDEAACANAAPEKKSRGDVLCLAIDQGMTKIALLLIEKGANVNNRYGNEATHYEYNVRSGSLFYHSSSSYEVTCWNGDKNLTPLLLAAKKNNADVVKALLKAGADITAKDDKGRTAQELATDPHVVALLTPPAPSTYQERLAALPNHDPVPELITCMISGKIMEKPVYYNDNFFDLESLKKINSQTTDATRIDYNRQPIAAGEYNQIMSLKVVPRLQSAVISFVEAQEKKAFDNKLVNKSFSKS